MTGRARGQRLLAGVCLALVVSAALLWAGSAWSSPASSSTASSTTASSSTASSFIGAAAAVALLALSGVAAVVATGGVARRVVGLLLAVVGTGACGVALTALADGLAPGPLCTFAGAALLLAAGVVVVVKEPGLVRFGARFSAAGERQAEVHPDRAAWQDLDAGRDPTAATSVPRGDDPEAGPQPV